MKMRCLLLVQLNPVCYYGLARVLLRRVLAGARFHRGSQGMNCALACLGCSPPFSSTTVILINRALSFLTIECYGQSCIKDTRACCLGDKHGMVRCSMLSLAKITNRASTTRASSTRASSGSSSGRNLDQIVRRGLELLSVMQ